MAMNWTRGLLRLWLVLSLLWLVAVSAVLDIPQNTVSAFTSEFQPTDLSASDLEVIEEGSERLVIQHGTTKFEVTKDGVDLTAQSEEDRRAMLEELVVEFNKRAAIENAHIRRAVHEARTGVAIAALPPVILLVLGGAFLWAIRGFGKDNT